MRTRPFHAGQYGTAGGVDYRIVAGRKQAREEGQHDLRVDVRSGLWVPVGMPLLMFLTDFLCDNEDVLYPPKQGFRGGQMLLDYLAGSRTVGWEVAANQLTEERNRKRAA